MIKWNTDNNKASNNTEIFGYLLSLLTIINAKNKLLHSSNQI